MIVPLAVDVEQSLQTAIDDVGEFLPNLVGAVAILLVGWLLALLVRALLTRALTKAGLDRAIGRHEGVNVIEQISPGGSFSRLLAVFAFWVLLIGAFALALESLDIEEVTNVVGDVYDYIPNLLAALAIFLGATLVSAGVADLARRTLGEGPTASIVRSAAPTVVWLIATFMILNELRIATEIVTITYAALVGALAVGMALAFGLGGRETAARMLNDAYERTTESTGRRQPLAGGRPADEPPR
jgi:predicted permease